MRCNALQMVPHKQAEWLFVMQFINFYLFLTLILIVQFSYWRVTVNYYDMPHNYALIRASCDQFSLLVLLSTVTLVEALHFTW